MPSPFPGMDPYLENSAIWPDFHLTMNTAMRAELNNVLTERYAARIDRERKSYLKIIDVQNHRVITVIELLSPTNKMPGKDYQAYLAKRDSYLASGVNLVEIDLLRAGKRPPSETAPPESDYYAIVCRASDFPSAGVWPISIREPLPAIPVPLLSGDAPVDLHLQECLNRAYDEGRYFREIDYSQPSEPPLNEADAAWAREMLAKTK